MQRSYEDLFPRAGSLIGVIHTGPSPGVPGFTCVDSCVDRAIAEAEAYTQGGVDGIIVENMHDFPCVHERDMGPEIAAFMTRIGRAVKRRAGRLPVGLHVLFQANRTSLAAALASGCDFVRAEGWTHAHISDKGVAEAAGGRTVRYRHQIGAGHLPIFTDIRKKHASHSWTADLGIADIACSMALHRSDAVIVTGPHTGTPPTVDDLVAVREATELPVVIGSGLTVENLDGLAGLADGYIVGSAMKEGGRWDAPVNEERVEAMVDAVRRIRSRHKEIVARN